VDNVKDSLDEFQKEYTKRELEAKQTLGQLSTQEI